MNKILIVFGNRPELIKLAPVIEEFCTRNLRDKLYIVNSNQHKEYTKKDLEYFQIDVDYNFDLERINDSLSVLNGLLLLQFDKLKNYFHNSLYNFLTNQLF